MVLMINRMRILVRLVLNWNVLEIISRFCATLSTIGCRHTEKRRTHTKRDLHIQKIDLHIQKRDLHIQKRDPNKQKRALNAMCSIHAEKIPFFKEMCIHYVKTHFRPKLNSKKTTIYMTQDGNQRWYNNTTTQGRESLWCCDHNIIAQESLNDSSTTTQGRFLDT